MVNLPPRRSQPIQEKSSFVFPDRIIGGLEQKCQKKNKLGQVAEEKERKTNAKNGRSEANNWLGKGSYILPN